MSWRVRPREEKHHLRVRGLALSRASDYGNCPHSYRDCPHSLADRCGSALQKNTLLEKSSGNPLPVTPLPSPPVLGRVRKDSKQAGAEQALL